MFMCVKWEPQTVGAIINRPKSKARCCKVRRRQRPLCHPEATPKDLHAVGVSTVLLLVFDGLRPQILHFVQNDRLV